MKVSDKRMQGHMINYDHIRSQMDSLAEDAIDSMKQLGRFDKNAMKVA
jgi:hypothetical protein